MTWPTLLMNWILAGDIWTLFALSFLESFISPILPDILLIPLAISDPSRAIEFAIVCIVGNILGGYVGYAIGYFVGPRALQRFIPEKHQDTFKGLAVKRGVWAIYIASILPIPFKIVSISAGVMRVPLLSFTIAAILGRTKRFLPIGIVLHFYGPDILILWETYTSELMWVAGLLCIFLGGWFWWRRA